MKIVCLSDTHGLLPELDLDRIDLVLHAGDYTLHNKHDIQGQLDYFENQFCPWVRRIASQTQFYYINGNHEVFAEKLNINTDYNDVTQKHCIDNSSVFLCDYNIKIYGNPYTPTFYNWAFNLPDMPDGLGKKFKYIPDSIDILVSHGPPHGVMDYVPGRLVLDRNTGEVVEIPACNAGSHELAKAITRVKPRLVVCGHLHSNFGVVKKEGVTYVGCSLMDENYQSNRFPIIIDL